VTPEPIVIDRRVAVPPEQVWPYLTDGSLWRRWQGVAATIDPRPGGEFTMVMGDGRTAAGEVIEVQPHARLSFTWGWTDAPDTLPPGSTTVEIELVPDGDGTVIRLTHSDLPPPAAALHRVGWLHYLGRLGQVAEGVDPGPDPGPG
jgi:uncharacterized protein YndB with AHSA1/START domain